ncbi:hypothetical protein VE01_09082 [Pseudogymnoascus verrucosus]|uniref:Uncharacterized protein n=1 Tax=Pseudogymnoascus verrucosus TaxID=342668 RepID=A0A1B8GAF9_9PEZI|nr:uncharacterized protein VE01_09082 [Pseudogymnoascus verrucosus]OBT92823.1 hypothetical protein VE01_09082 [Pseudogymnoascus verrucosus]
MLSNDTALLFAEISAKSSENRTPESQLQSASRFLHEAENHSTPRPGVPIVRDYYSDLYTPIRHQTSPVGNLWVELPKSRRFSLS